MLCLENEAEARALVTHYQLGMSDGTATMSVVLSGSRELSAGTDVEGNPLALPLVCAHSVIESKREGVPMSRLMMSPQVPSLFSLGEMSVTPSAPASQPVAYEVTVPAKCQTVIDASSRRAAHVGDATLSAASSKGPLQQMPSAAQPASMAMLLPTPAPVATFKPLAQPPPLLPHPAELPEKPLGCVSAPATTPPQSQPDTPCARPFAQTPTMLPTPPPSSKAASCVGACSKRRAVADDETESLAMPLFTAAATSAPCVTAPASCALLGRNVDPVDNLRLASTFGSVTVPNAVALMRPLPSEGQAVACPPAAPAASPCVFMPAQRQSSISASTWVCRIDEADRVDSARLAALEELAAIQQRGLIAQVVTELALQLAGSTLRARYHHWLSQGRKTHPQWLGKLAAQRVALSVLHWRFEQWRRRLMAAKAIAAAYEAKRWRQRSAVGSSLTQAVTGAFSDAVPLLPGWCTIRSGAGPFLLARAHAINSSASTCAAENHRERSCSAQEMLLPDAANALHTAALLPWRAPTAVAGSSTVPRNAMQSRDHPMLCTPAASKPATASPLLAWTFGRSLEDSAAAAAAAAIRLRSTRIVASSAPDGLAQQVSIDEPRATPVRYAKDEARVFSTAHARDRDADADADANIGDAHVHREIDALVSQRTPPRLEALRSALESARQDQQDRWCAIDNATLREASTHTPPKTQPPTTERMEHTNESKAGQSAANRVTALQESVRSALVEQAMFEQRLRGHEAVAIPSTPRCT